ncbi:MAG: hypothetical protein FJ125_14025 [Deltaproteobacteria bacterium]|nr:hypothetical protein [Deltaproteobacteria bacterium]
MQAGQDDQRRHGQGEGTLEHLRQDAQLVRPGLLGQRGGSRRGDQRPLPTAAEVGPHCPEQHAGRAAGIGHAFPAATPEGDEPVQAHRRARGDGRGADEQRFQTFGLHRPWVPP